MKKIGDIFSEFFKENFGKSFEEYNRKSIFSSWEKIINEAWPQDDEVHPAAAHSKIRELDKGVLLVEADHPGWVQTLGTKKAELLLAAQNQFPELEIKSINIRLSR